MKIALFINRDLEANITYNLLKSELLKHTVRIYYSVSVGSLQNKAPELVKLEYYEKGFVFDELKDYTSKHKIRTTFEFFDNDFKTFPIQQCQDVNSTAFINEMKAFSPDLFLSIRFGRIFKNEIIQVPKRGLLNLHSAILPNYRGIMGTLHAIKEKNKKIGCTLHTIPNSGIDTGEIIEIATVDVNLRKSVFWHIVQLYPIGAKLIIKHLQTLNQQHSLKTHKQNLEDGNYFSVPTQVDFERIEQMGIEIITGNDYLEVLSSFILKDLSEINRHHLIALINNSGLNFKN
ncbi:MAG: formyltransferase family protein [Putridiphycobacter sp.]|nr:formyltransferase family protein [Putridiphycobacter sp.]